MAKITRYTPAKARTSLTDRLAGQINPATGSEYTQAEIEAAVEAHKALPTAGQKAAYTKQLLGAAESIARRAAETRKQKEKDAGTRHSDQTGTLSGQPAPAEVRDLVHALARSEAGASAVLMRIGMEEGGAMTLDACGKRLGLTRERVRQLERTFERAVENLGRPVEAPALTRALAVLRDAAPISLPDAKSVLLKEGLVDADTAPEALIAAARLFELTVPFDVAKGMLFPAGDAESLLAVPSVARRLVSHWGATTVDEVCATLADGDDYRELDAQAVRGFLDSVQDATWLDDDRNWFWIKGTSRNRLLNQIEKIMSVAGSIELAELRHGVGRHHRMKGFRPPREVLANLCVDSGLYERRGTQILGTSSLPDWRDILGKIETTLVEILFDHGPVMRRTDLEKLAVEAGVNRNSFYVYLTYSPVLERYAPGVYGLRGASVSAAEIKALIPPRTRTQVLQDHGWTAEGRVWIVYKLSEAGVATGVLGVPAVLDDLLRGSFALSTEDGRAVGTVAVDDSMWGLSPFFRRFGVEEGDHIAIEFDLANKAATIVAGTAELLLRDQKGE